MGLLDDAIREHLELKRRRGGDPAEIARAEQEALGPVRREPEPAPPAAEDHHEVVESPVYEDAPSPPPPSPATHDFDDFDDEPAAPPAPQEERTQIIPPHERPDAHAPEREEPRHEPSHDEPEPPAAAHRPRHDDAAAPRPAEEPVDPRHSDIVHQPTTEFRVEDHHDDEDPPSHAPGSDEDVLEETPDFLQETPEHDRLWFEQRPPRDFDFDD